MEAICVGKGILIGINLICRLFWYKIRSSCTYNEAQYLWWYVLRRIIAIHSHPSKQQITNLMKCRVATGVTPAYNTTNSPNKLLSHQFKCNVHAMKLQKFLQFYCIHNHPLFCVEKIQMLNTFIPIRIPFPTHIASIFYH